MTLTTHSPKVRDGSVAVNADSPRPLPGGPSYCGECACEVDIGDQRHFEHKCKHRHTHVVTFSISSAQRERWLTW